MIVFGNRYRGEGRTYLHEMGMEVTDENMTAKEAGTRAGLDYTITKRPLMTRNSKGHMVNVPDHYAVMSDYDGDPDIIAIVGKEFAPIQNMHLADMLDRAGLTGPASKYGLDVVGKTADGRTVFWSLKETVGYEINHDAYHDHWIITDGKDGNRALTIALTPTRFECSNAIAMAVAGATIRVGIQHTKAAQAELNWWLSITPQLERVAKTNRELMKRLGKITVNGIDVDTILEAAYPKPKVRGRAQLYNALADLKLSEDDASSVEQAQGSHATEALRVLAKREFVKELFADYAHNPAERNMAGTALGLINAVADFENHRAPTNSREMVAVSNLYGPRYQAQAASIKATLAHFSDKLAA